MPSRNPSPVTEPQKCGWDRNSEYRNPHWQKEMLFPKPAPMNVLIKAGQRECP